MQTSTLRMQNIIIIFILKALKVFCDKYNSFIIKGSHYIYIYIYENS